MDTKQNGPIGVAIFGLGRIGKVHLHSLAKTFRVDVLWIVDHISAHDDIRKLLQKYRLEHVTKLVSLEDEDKVYSDPSVAAVFVCSPTVYHEPTIKRALHAGKHVFSEKPLAESTELIRSCYTLAEKANRVLYCGFNRRYDPNLDSIMKKKQNGDLGDIRQVYMISRDPPVPMSYIRGSGGIYRDYAVHQIDFVCYFLGERPLTLVAYGNTKSQQGEDYRDCDDVDLSTVILTFPSGTIGIVETSRETTFGFDLRLEVLGSKAMAVCENVPLTSTKVFVNNETVEDPRRDNTVRFAESFEIEENFFLDTIQGKMELPVKPEECIMVAELAQLCEESYRTGQVVRVPQ